MLELSGQRLALEQVALVASKKLHVRLSPEARERMAASRAIVEEILTRRTPVYGVNTGFGKLSDVQIPEDQLQALQRNLVRSHACGVGEPLSAEETRLMLLLRANVLAKGLSGARPEIAETLLAMLAQDVLPVVPSRGSVGASGDLAPLAHLALVIIGDGEAMYQGRCLAGAEALQRADIHPVVLEAKEGLALLNGTQAMLAVGSLALVRARRLVALADLAGAMSLESLKGTPVAFDARIHDTRPHPFQSRSAARLRALMHGSEIRESHLEDDPRVQDPYSLRCMPQVHGACAEAIDFAVQVFERETGSATDNPLVFENGDVLSGGNFHGAPLAHALDFCAISLTDLASISERRIDRLVNPDLNEGLPAFLSEEPGRNSGFMIAHVAAVALLNECKVLSHPASVDNLPTSGAKEDHVSMGMTSALKLRSILDHAEQVIAIEMLAAAEGLHYRLPLRPGNGIRKAYEVVRSRVPHLTEDRVLAPDMKSIAQAIRSGEFDTILSEYEQP